MAITETNDIRNKNDVLQAKVDQLTKVITNYKLKLKQAQEQLKKSLSIRAQLLERAKEAKVEKILLEEFYYQVYFKEIDRVEHLIKTSLALENLIFDLLNLGTHEAEKLKPVISQHLIEIKKYSKQIIPSLRPFPRKIVNFALNKDCTDHCKQRRLALLANMPTAFNSTRAMAILDLKDFNTFDDYLLQVKRKYSGNTYRDACKAKKLGFYCKLFVRDNYIYDIWQINTSKSIRQGEMRAPYLYSLDELGGLSQTEKLFTPPYCNLHTDYWFGIFERSEGYKQGGEGLETGEKLIGYILLERHGEFAHLRHILGHGDYLKYGIMYFLFFELVKWVYCTLPGLFYISYAGWTELVGQIDSRPGLTMWKKKALFQPRYLMETLNLSRQELLQEINEKTEKRPFPEYTLVNAKSGLCMYSVALYGQRDVIHLYNHGLEDVTLVDIDEEKMLEMKKIYPENWKYIVGDAFNFVKQALKHGNQYDIIILDPWVYLEKPNVGIIRDIVSLCKLYVVISLTSYSFFKPNHVEETKEGVFKFFQKRDERIIDADLSVSTPHDGNLYWVVLKRG